MIALDNCSALHLCVVPVPIGLKSIFNKDQFKASNYDKIKRLVDNNKVYHFEPVNFSFLAPIVIKELLGAGENPNVMMSIAQLEIKKALKNFLQELDGWGKIPKKSNADCIKSWFKSVEKDLKKENNIPEDEDCEILYGYVDFEGTDKILVSHDEHFWGYNNQIKQEYGITVYAEWDCHKI